MLTRQALGFWKLLSQFKFVAEEQFVEDPCRNYPVQWNKEKWNLLWVLLGGLKDVICNDLHVLLITAKVRNSKYAYF